MDWLKCANQKIILHNWELKIESPIINTFLKTKLKNICSNDGITVMILATYLSQWNDKIVGNWVDLSI